MSHDGHRNGCEICGNILWIIFGGFFLSLFWALIGVIFCITIIGIPWGKQCFKIAHMELVPFGLYEIERHNSCGCPRCCGNLLWLPLGLVFALTQGLLGVLFCITIIGIPFGIQHFKIAGLAIWPMGSKLLKAGERLPK